jgi:hypothetical protein
MLGNSWAAERLLSSQVELNSMELVSSLLVTRRHKPQDRILRSHRRRSPKKNIHFMAVRYTSLTLHRDKLLESRFVLLSFRETASTVQDACWCLCKGVGQKRVCDWRHTWQWFGFPGQHCSCCLCCSISVHGPTRPPSSHVKKKTVHFPVTVA